MDISELELLAAIRKVLSGAGPEVRVGVGDDAAVVAPGAGDLVLTTDALVEGSHFIRGLTSARDLGYKAIVVNVSDIAAMGASPRAAVCALTLSDQVDAAWMMELFGGMREACDEYALWLVGGNLAHGTEVTVSVTVTGEVAPSARGAPVGRAARRSGGGDRLPRRGGGRPAPVPPEEDVGRRRACRDRATFPARGTRRGGGGAGASRRHRDDRRSATGSRWISCVSATRAGPASGSTSPTCRWRPRPPSRRRARGGEDYELIATLPDDAAVSAVAAELRDGFGVALTVIGVDHRGGARGGGA